MKKLFFILTPGLLFLSTLIIELIFDNHIVLWLLSFLAMTIFYTLIFTLKNNIREIRNFELEEEKLSKRVPIKNGFFNFFKY